MVIKEIKILSQYNDQYIWKFVLSTVLDMKSYFKTKEIWQHGTFGFEPEWFLQWLRTILRPNFIVSKYHLALEI